MSVRNVVLVHGAFADGSSCSKVIPLLLAKGHRVTSVATPLTSFAEDVAATTRAIGIQAGPVLLVGHSYGGVVITETGNDPKVAGSHAVMLSHAREVAQVIDEAARAVGV
jgi:pimeloyl-ACP methyl ester carboxylesterase